MNIDNQKEIVNKVWFNHKFLDNSNNKNNNICNQIK